MVWGLPLCSLEEVKEGNQWLWARWSGCDSIKAINYFLASAHRYAPKPRQPILYNAFHRNFLEKTSSKWPLTFHLASREVGGARSTYGGEERCIKVFVGKPEGKRLFGRPRLRWDEKNGSSGSAMAEFTELIWLRIGTDGGLLWMW